CARTPYYGSNYDYYAMDYW
nr:immunoglobulin heavy chain junction region [Mus musculus]